MKESRKDLGVVKKLFENRGYRKTKPDIELLLAEIGGIVRPLLTRCRFIVYQKYENVVQDVETFLKLLFG